jgi:hypothetical protein
MREIKFRQPIYRIGGGLWRAKFHYWHYWGFINGAFVGPKTMMPPIDNGTITVKDAEETSQEFTGLHDKNGKEIYGGDIVESLCGGKERYVVKYAIDASNVHKGFVLHRKGYLHGYWDADQEIIGNIHENPELLEKEDDQQKEASG